MLRPLQQWTCDYCRLVIDAGNEGALEWLEDKDHRAYGFKIVHHLAASPVRITRSAGCYHYAAHSNSAEEPLDAFLGPDGLARVLLFLDVDWENCTSQVIGTRDLVE